MEVEGIKARSNGEEKVRSCEMMKLSSEVRATFKEGG